MITNGRECFGGDNDTEVLALKQRSKWGLFFAILGAAVTLLAAAGAILLIFEKRKKDEEELEHYLDCSIQ